MGLAKYIRKKEKRRKFHPSLWLISPMALLYGLFVIGGIVSVVIESTGFIPALGMNRISASSYAEILSNDKFRVGIAYSLYIAFVAVSISTFIGVIVAYYMVVSTNYFIVALTKKLLQVGLILPYLYMVLVTVITIGRTGIISRLLYQVGFIHAMDAFPRLLHEPWGIGIITVYILKGIPFVALFTLNVMGSMSRTYYEVARTLGAKGFAVLRKVYLPMVSNAIVWSSSILVIYDLGAFEVPYLLETNRYVPISSQLYSLYLSPQIQTIPKSMAMNIIVLIVSSIAVFVYAFLLKRFLRGGGK